MHKHYKHIEEVLKRQHTAYLEQLILLYGIEVRLYRQYHDTHSSVYGTSSGKVDDEYENLLCIITGDEFTPTTDALSGAMDQGWLYSNESEHIRTGDQVEVRSEDGRSRRYKIESKEALGTTKNVFNRYKLSALGD